MSSGSVISYPIPPYQNVAIQAYYFKPKQFVISDVTLGLQTIVTTVVANDYVIGQEVRLIIPSSFGCFQLNGRQGYVLAIPSLNQVILDIDSSQNVDAYIASTATTKAQILAIGDINNGVISHTGRNIPDNSIPGAFKNISPRVGIDETKKPNINSESEKELDKATQQIDAFTDQINTMTLDRMNMTPKEETEPQTKMSQNEIANSKDIYLKPHRAVSCQDKFNENFRDEYNFQKQYVQFQAENKEIIGESIDIWTRPFSGMPAEWWKVPVNKPVWGPRYLAEQIKRCYYHRLIMQPHQTTGADGMGQYYGSMAVDSTVADWMQFP